MDHHPDQAPRTDAVEPGMVFLSAAYFFLLLASYYILQPIRDELGISGGIENLPWLFIASLLVMLGVNPLFSRIVARMPRHRFIPLVNRFFLSHLLVFWAAFSLAPPDWKHGLGYAFFLWVSVFNLFVVSVFWGFMADLFTSGQGKKAFGLIGAGGTIGEIVGSGLTAFLSAHLGSRGLMLVSCLLLEGATQAALRLGRYRAGDREGGDSAARPTARPGGAETSDLLAGIRAALSSKYLLGICLYMFLYTITSSFLYFEKAAIVKEAVADPAAQRAFFATVNLWVSSLSLLIQLFLTGKILSGLGVGVALGLVPTLTAGGFLWLGLAPTLTVYAVFEVARKTLNYAVARPARELLYTVVSRDEKYQAKSFIDTFVYRAGDAVAAGAFKVLQVLGLGLPGMAFAAVPAAVVWMLTGWWLGRRQAQAAAQMEKPVPTT